MDAKKFGKRLKTLRQAKNLTMKELGKIFSVAESTISGYENGNRKPDMDMIEKFADYFEVDINYLYGRDTSSNEGLFFFDIEDLSEEEIEDIRRHIDYVKWKSKQEKGNTNE